MKNYKKYYTFGNYMRYIIKNNIQIIYLLMPYTDIKNNVILKH